MAIGQQNRSTAIAILQIGISHNTNCAIKDSFHKDNHIMRELSLYYELVDHTLLQASFGILYTVGYSYCIVV